MFLSIDTYSENLGICLINGSSVVYRLSIQKVKPFSELIVSKLDSIFKELGLSPEIISGVSVNRGPGSYTGIRVGISVAKTLSYSLQIPLYSFETHDVIAYKYRHYKGNILIAINGGQKEAYVREYFSDGIETKAVSDYKIIKIKELREKIKEFNDYLVIEKNIDLSVSSVIKEMEDLSLDGFNYSIRKKRKENPLFLEPLYLRSL